MLSKWLLQQPAKGLEHAMVPIVSPPPLVVIRGENSMALAGNVGAVSELVGVHGD